MGVTIIILLPYIAETVVLYKRCNLFLILKICLYLIPYCYSSVSEGLISCWEFSFQGNLRGVFVDLPSGECFSSLTASSEFEVSSETECMASCLRYNLDHTVDKCYAITFHSSNTCFRGRSGVSGYEWGPRPEHSVSSHDILFHSASAYV